MSNQFTSNHSNHKSDAVSELLDDCGSNESLEQVLSSDEQQNKWYRFNLVRAVLNKQHSIYSSNEFTQTIAAKIALEPSIISQPKVAQTNVVTNSGNVISLWKKAAGGMAIAASVAFAMVFSVQMMNAPEQQLNSYTAQIEIPVDRFRLTTLTSESEVAEQAKLDEIQAILNSIGKSNLNVNEQMVGGERIVSKIIKSNQLEELERQVRNMKKPSEVELKN